MNCLRARQARGAAAAVGLFFALAARLKAVEQLACYKRDNQEHGSHTKNEYLRLVHDSVYLLIPTGAARPVLPVQKALVFDY